MVFAFVRHATANLMTGAKTLDGGGGLIFLKKYASIRAWLK